MMRWQLALAFSLASAPACAGSLPRVAPPGPGMSSPAAPSNGAGELAEKYERRLEDRDDALTVPVPAPAKPSAIYPEAGGAVTDTGVPLSGRAGTLRDPGGGVWNCTSAGCFSPDGTFLPMKKAPPATPAD